MEVSLKDLKVVKELGQGSYSTVQLVQKENSSQLFALKTVKMGKLTIQDKQAALNEIRILASISSPLIICYEGSFYNRDSNSLCILMEYAEEGDLQTIINKCAEENQMKRGLPQKFIWATLVDVLKGLQLLHKNKIVHRDIKSANIFYSKGNAKIGDFNVSKISDNQMFSTKTGTPYYTSPQIWKGQLYDSRCDIWSLGCILYQMCALLPPFRSSNFPELFITISKGFYEALPTYYSEQLRIIIQMCLQVEPENRPSASQLLQNSFVSKYAFGRSKNDSETIINMLDPLKYPKVFKNNNFLLPKPLKSRTQLPGADKRKQNQFKISKKKTVDFGDIQRYQQKKNLSPLNRRKQFVGTSIRVKKASKHTTFVDEANSQSVSSFTQIRTQKAIKSLRNINLFPQLKKNSVITMEKQQRKSKRTQENRKNSQFRLKSAVKSQKFIEKENLAF